MSFEGVRRWHLAILTMKRYIEDSHSTSPNDKGPQNEDEGPLYPEFLLLSGMSYIIA